VRLLSLAEDQRSADRNELVISYLCLRQVVGWIGTLLPIVLLVGGALSSQARPDSMSGYYYTDMRNVFVGALCALGAFLGAYDGYDCLDRWITNIAGFCAIGVAFCPTKPTVCAAGAGACPASSVTQLSTLQQVVGDLHVFFAVTTFTMLGLMALRFATDGKTPRYRGAICIYRASGSTILSCVLLAVLSNLLPASVNAHWPLLFIFEAIAVFSFGVSWFVKGRTMDDPEPGLRAAPTAAVAGLPRRARPELIRRHDG
jgi:hypothetical protein